uniref:Uncharacterized protein n=1 Tax=Anguilla anguilla TaxID=7936 RepID=A0A0E9VBX8_ANGAN
MGGCLGENDRHREKNLGFHVAPAKHLPHP